MSASNVYKFTYKGTRYEVPKFNTIPAGVLRKTRKLDDLDKAFTIIELMIGEDSDALNALDSMDQDTFGEWMNGWIGAAGDKPVSLGESSGS